MTKGFITDVMPGITNSMMDVENREASNFIIEHYDELVVAAKKMGVDEGYCGDIVSDVYVSMLKAENNNCGFNINGGSSESTTVAQFVYGRLKGYSKNSKYRNDVARIEIAASSSATDDLDSLTGVQKAYEMAESYDDLEFIEASLSIPEELEYLLSFERDTDVNIRYILKNVSRLANMSFDVSLLSGLKKLIANDADFFECLKSVMEFAGKHTARYEAIVASI